MRISRAGWALMTLLSLMIVVLAAQYFAFDPDTYFPDQREVYLTKEFVLGMHIGGAVLALALGPFQFSAKLRGRAPRVHRTMGALYLIGCLVGAAGGLGLAGTAHGGIVSTIGFTGLAIGWLITGGMGLKMVLAGRIAEHRRWMVRSFALTFAAVTLRLYLLVYGGLADVGVLDVDFTTAYTAIAWLCWVPNLAVALWITRKPVPAMVKPPTAGTRSG